MKKKLILDHLLNEDLDLYEWIRVNDLLMLERDFKIHASLILDVAEDEILEAFLRMAMASVRIRVRDILEDTE